MRNVFLFIRRYFNLIFFLLLQVFSLMMLFRYNRFHESVYAVFANELAGKINLRYSNVQTYFTLRKENESLRRQNADLLNRMKADFSWPDSTYQIYSDTIRIDSLEQYRKFLYLPARVISNSVNAQQNYLMLHRGTAQGVSQNMAVVGPDGVIGTVINASRNMCVVMSMLHRQTKIIAVMKKGSDIGEISWDGKDPRYVTLSKIPKSITVAKGDTVVTSSYSDRYPPGHVVGFVETVAEDQGTSTYILKVRTAVNFYSVQHAYVVQNLQKAEMEELEKSLKKNQ
jgi:rod shape-determining protein MreC